MKGISFFFSASRKQKARLTKRRLFVEPLENRSLLSGNVISGFVFVDANNNGLFDPGETALPNVAVRLINSSNLLVGSTVTDATGAYAFNVDIPSKTLTETASVPLTPTNWPQGLGTLSIPQFNPALGTLTGIQITNAGTFETDIQVVNGPSASVITGIDAGTLTLSGPGLSGLLTSMYSSETSPLIPANASYDFGQQTAPGSNTATIASGSWSQYVGTGMVTLTDVATAQSSASSNTGNFTVSFSTSAGAQVSVAYTYIPTTSYTIVDTPPPGYLDGLLSSNGQVLPTSVGQHSIPVTLVNSNSTNNDFAELAPASLAGFVYMDGNDNGFKDNNERGIPGVPVTLTGINDLGISVTASQSTAADGSYQFGNLRPGTYTLTESPPTNYLQGKDTIGSIGGIAGADAFSSITVPVGAAGINYNFGELLPSSLTGFVYLDSNNNGAKDLGESGIAGVTVTLTGADDRGTSVMASQNTAADGSYQFGNLRPGTYTLTENPPANYLQGKDAIGSIGGIAGVDVFSSITVPVGAGGINYDFGEQLPGSLSGFVFLDSNNDGIKEAGDSGIGNVAITLTGTTDLGGSVSGIQYTKQDGSYRFANLLPGSYTISKTPPPSYLDGKESLGSAGGNVAIDQFTGINLGGGLAGVNYNFGELLPPSSLAGFVYLDSNNNGFKDAGERGIMGVTVTLTGTDNLGNAVSTSTTTLSDGSYQFTNLRPGTYTLTETPPAHYLQGMDRIGSIGGIAGVDVFSSITVPAGSAGVNYNFGHQLASSVSGFVFLDSNNDGIMQSGESGIAGVAITLSGPNDLGGSVSGTQFTGADGSYLFGNLLPGNYTITKTPPPAYIDGKESLGTAGGNVAVDQFTGINLPGGVAGINYNFAELLPPSGTGIIYSDFFSPNKTSFPPPDLNILSKLQFLSNSGTQTIDPTTLAQATWVDGIYETLLNRTADSTGLLNWVILLHNGMPRSQVVSAIWNSAEHRTLEVDQFYQTFFNRAADGAGQAYFVNALLSGMTETQVAAAFVTSPEFATTHPTNQTYVLGLYADILGRSASNQEVQGWIQQLNQGVSRAAIAAAFLTSSESYQRIIGNDYLSYLNRSVDQAGLQGWLAALLNGQATPASVTVGILASDEFYNEAVAASPH